MEKYILYTRVSTQKQGLGLEAQRSAAYTYISANGGEIIGEYQEKESGKKDDRPQLAAALADCKRNDATLIIAKLDRLSRKVSFIFSLRDSGAKFLALDLPDFNTMSLAIYASMAQHERELISQRTTAALQELKRKGRKLGAPNATFTDDMRKASVEARRSASLSNERNRRAYYYASLAKGLPLAQIAIKLNEGGFKTAKGGKWHGNQVRRLLDMFEA